MVNVSERNNYRNRTDFILPLWSTENFSKIWVLKKKERQGTTDKYCRTYVQLTLFLLDTTISGPWLNVWQRIINKREGKKEILINSKINIKKVDFSL